MKVLTLEIESVAPATVAAAVGVWGVRELLAIGRLREAAVMAAFVGWIVTIGQLADIRSAQ